MKTQKDYNIGKIKQLIDINGDITNFDCTFNVISKDGSDFEAVVIDQTTLDNTNPIYQKAPGTISGNILADKNIYQNYFLLLKSDNNCECSVTIDLKEIHPRVQQDIKHPPLLENFEKLNSPSKFTFNWKYILIFILIAGGLYYFYTRRNKNSKEELIIDSLPISKVTSPNIIRPARSPSLLDKLNDLPI